MGFPGSLAGEVSTCSVADLGLIPGLGRCPGGGHGNSLQYSCLENPHGQRSLAGYSPWGRKESDTTEWLSITQHKLSTDLKLNYDLILLNDLCEEWILLVLCIFIHKKCPFMFLLFLCFLPFIQILCPNNDSKPIVTHLIFYYMNKFVLPLIHIPCMFALLYACKVLIMWHDSPPVCVILHSHSFSR